MVLLSERPGHLPIWLAGSALCLLAATAVHQSGWTAIALLPLSAYVAGRLRWPWLRGRLIAGPGMLRAESVVGALTVLPHSILVPGGAWLALADRRSRRYFALVRRQRQNPVAWRRFSVLWHSGVLWGDHDDPRASW
ncbi:MAG: hypothetical protein AAGH76_05500 [Pseudomonadota bacterium]